MREDIFKCFHKALCARLAGLDALAGLDLSAVALTPPRSAAHGDMATNAALVLARAAAMPARALAEIIASALQTLDGVRKVDIAGPGFINLYLSPAIWQEEIAAILAAGENYGASAHGRGVKVNIEYVSANPTGPMHIGHARGAVFGDALARLMSYAGFEVVREYYVNDQGAQIDALADSVFLRAREALGESIEMKENFYPGDYLIPLGEALAEDYGAALKDMDESKRHRLLRERSVAAMMADIKADLARLGVRHDIFTYESALHESGAVEEAVDYLRQRDLIFEGKLDAPKGKKAEDWEAREQTLFRASLYGDDADRAMCKADGSWTYFASDMAYHYDKYRRGFKLMINVFGADHGGYVKRLQAAVRALSEDDARLDVRLIHLVRFLHEGAPVKMSKRAGTFTTLRDLVDEIGCDAARFIMLTRKNDAPLDVDLKLIKEQSNDNPVFYVQYAHARCCSVISKAQPESSSDQKEPDLLALNDPAELALIKMLCRFPRETAAAALASEPHRLAFYLHDLAALFHALWNKGKEDPALRFIAPIAQVNGDKQKSRSDVNILQARLCLIRATRQILASGLKLMGVAPVEDMR